MEIFHAIKGKNKESHSQLSNCASEGTQGLNVCLDCQNATYATSLMHCHTLKTKFQHIYAAEITVKQKALLLKTNKSPKQESHKIIPAKASRWLKT